MTTDEKIDLIITILSDILWMVLRKLAPSIGLKFIVPPLLGQWKYEQKNDAK